MNEAKDESLSQDICEIKEADLSGSIDAVMTEDLWERLPVQSKRTRIYRLRHPLGGMLVLLSASCDATTGHCTLYAEFFIGDESFSGAWMTKSPRTKKDLYDAVVECCEDNHSFVGNEKMLVGKGVFRDNQTWRPVINVESQSSPPSHRQKN